jgi:hypothetical protein
MGQLGRSLRVTGHLLITKFVSGQSTLKRLVSQLAWACFPGRTQPQIKPSSAILSNLTKKYLTNYEYAMIPNDFVYTVDSIFRLAEYLFHIQVYSWSLLPKRLQIPRWAW